MKIDEIQKVIIALCGRLKHDLSVDLEMANDALNALERLRTVTITDDPETWPPLKKYVLVHSSEVKQDHPDVARLTYNGDYRTWSYPGVCYEMLPGDRWCYLPDMGE